jgi:hypothetical protein
MESMVNKITVNLDVETIDIPTMESLSIDKYRDYVKDGGLFMVDHHHILRSSSATYPIASSKAQLEVYISELEQIKSQLL